MIGRVIKVMKASQNTKKGPLSHQKMKCSFLDYIQLLMICRAMSNESQPKCQKRPPKSSKNELLIFGLCSTSDDPPSDLNNESQPKWEGISMKDYISTWTAVP